MAKTMYEKSVRLLLQDMLQEFQLKPGQIITTGRVLNWFSNKYPKLQPSGIKANLVMLSVNDSNRLHHQVKPADDILFKVATGQFRLYEPGKDAAPIHELIDGDVAAEEAQQMDAEDDDDGKPSVASEFQLERDLQNYLAKNLSCIEPGLQLYEEDGVKGYEFDAGGRYIDILAKDKSGVLVVLELKVSRGHERVIGQILRYVNWVRQNLAEPGQKVRGMIVCRAVSQDLRLACASLVDVELYEYQLSVTVAKVPALTL